MARAHRLAFKIAGGVVLFVGFAGICVELLFQESTGSVDLVSLIAFPAFVVVGILLIAWAGLNPAWGEESSPPGQTR